MIGFILSLALVAAAGANDSKVYKRFYGVDPNTLSCDPLGQVFLLLPHFTDCNKYFSCAHGREVEFTCPGNTIFDFPLQTCNWDWATRCYLRDNDFEGSGFDEHDGVMASSFLGEEEGNVEAGEPSSLLRAASADQMQQFIGILNCQDLAEAPIQIAYKGDCQRYWKCASGVPSSAYCADGLYFNPQRQQCDFEANVKCSVETEQELDGEFMVYDK